MPLKSPPARQRVQLTLPSDLVDAFEEKGKLSKRSAEDEMALRLSSCRDHTSATALYLDDTTRVALELIAGRKLTSGGDLLAWAKTLASLSVAGTQVPLGEQLLKRLDGRRFGKSMQEYVKHTTLELLEQSVGMR